ncbi:hypothetical protein MPTK1_5g15530 [Marchantia polymorpha subsp. ruderalis]|uniref:Uncharacterized protein n=2 Tax=Marchantia polymorpha TaxID=3197 RepID=A0AAF6BIP6_MARPO|nr:hypothetical protein MARPO_0071s0056 [Marchantia polymorpha]BBN11880.1 hypothetical protein Mp_5g15530 [Marchantia polymorpha subsp. ruderalis]|eukprot:PTQ35440.1 hypothetical protein MARPO_0071s0056 [Marchantia polymorpha]
MRTLPSRGEAVAGGGAWGHFFSKHCLQLCQRKVQLALLSKGACLAQGWSWCWCWCCFATCSGRCENRLGGPAAFVAGYQVMGKVASEEDQCACSVRRHHPVKICTHLLVRCHLVTVSATGFSMFGYC